MESIKFQFEDSLVSAQEMEHVGKELISEIQRIGQARSHKYDTPYASINAPFDQQNISKIQLLVQEKKALKPSLLVLIGIGGSNLGTVAIYQALGARAQDDQTTDLICADTIDSDTLARHLQRVEEELKDGNNIIINAITKSGTTTETIINFELFLNVLKKYHPEDYQQYVVVISDDGSAFSQFAENAGFATLAIPPKIGGRYSVFSSVGLFPLSLLGINIERILAGAKEIVPTCISPNILENPAAMSAIIKFIQYQQCVNINDFFVFAIDAQGIGLWYRQLLGESIGKELNTRNQRVEVGITPTVSVGTIDLHSVGQLYLGGPRDKFTTFVELEHPSHELLIPHMPEFEQFVAKIQGRNVSDVMEAILEGVRAAYRSNKRPFYSIVLPRMSPENIGQLLQFYMIEMMYLGFLFEVNPFDQPNVELYKTETRKILAEQ